MAESRQSRQLQQQRALCIYADAASTSQGLSGNSSQRRRCPLCSPRSQKVYQIGRGFRMHCESIHSSLPVADIQAAVESMLATTQSAKSAGKKRPHSSLEDSSCSSPIPPIALKCASADVSVMHPVLIAARDGNTAELSTFAEKNGWPTLLAVSDKHGSRAVHWAAGAGQVQVLRLIAASTASSESSLREPCGKLAKRRDGRQPIHWAARNNHPAAIEYLLTDCSDVLVDALTFDGTTPLMLAAFGGGVEACKMLCKYGASLQAANNWECNVAHWAAMGGSVAVLEWLRDATQPNRSIEAAVSVPAAVAVEENQLIVVENIKLESRQQSVAANETSSESRVAVTVSAISKEEITHTIEQAVQTDIGTMDNSFIAPYATQMKLFSALQKEAHSVLHKAAQRQHAAALRWLQSLLRGFGVDKLEACSLPDSMGFTPEAILAAVSEQAKAS